MVVFRGGIEMMPKFFTYIFSVSVVLFSLNLPLAAQTDEADPLNNPLPKTGMWIPADGSGTGILLEVQDGILVGALFGADAVGDNTWVLFSGELVPRINEESGTQVGWMLNAILYRTTGSACIVECPLGPNPGAPVTTEAGQITLAFSGRSSATFRIDDAQAKPIAPFYFGVLARRFNPARPLDLLPELSGTWLLVSDQGGIFGSGQPGGAAVVRIGDPEIIRNPSAELDEVMVEIVYPVGPVSGDSDSELSCRFRRREDPQSAVPACTMVPGFAPMSVGTVPFDEITDSRFTVFSSDDVLNVTRTDFFRLAYD
jgi:hypothetical protein